MKGNDILPWWAWPIAAIALVLAGLCAGFFIYGPKDSVAETYAASAVQSDGSIVLERKPDAAASAPMAVPKGGKVERVVRATVKPTSASCPDVSLDLALVRMPDSTRRVVASSPDGQIVAGVDIPIETASISDQPKWAAGLSYSTERRGGIWIDRDIGALRAGVAVRQDKSNRPVAEARLGIRF